VEEAAEEAGEAEHGDGKLYKRKDLYLNYNL